MTRTRDETITPGGIRLVGRARDLVSQAALVGLRPPGETDRVFEARFDVRPRLGAGGLPQCLDVLTRTLQKHFPDLPPLDPGLDLQRHLGRVLALEWRTVRVGARWTGELLWRIPHPFLRGTQLTTHVILSDQPGQLRLAVRTGVPGGVSGTLGLVGAGQSRPTFLAELNRVVRLVYGGSDSAHRVVSGEDIDHLVGDVLLSESREFPALVLSPTESGEYLLPPEQLAEEFLGLAHLHVLDRHATSFRLTDALGDKRLSCFWGAMRVYLPEFSCADSPHDHPLLMTERLLDPMERAKLVGTLARERIGTVAWPLGVDALRAADSPGQPVPPAAVEAAPAASESLPPAPARQPDDRPSTQIVDALAAQTALLTQLLEVNRRLLEEMVTLRTSNAVRGSAAAALDRRLAALERLIAGARGQPDPAADPARPEASSEPAIEPEPVTLESVVREAAVTLEEDLLITDPAIEAAAESPFEDVDRASAVLNAMALVSRQRVVGSLGRSLREAFRELGVDYRPGIAESTSARLREQYRVRLADGREIEATEHIAVGNSYDPRYCLRIYFSSRVPGEPRFVVAHVGRHHEVGSTS